MKSKTTIELNGKQYDAVTGIVLGAATAPTVPSASNIDGFFRGRNTTATTSKTPPATDTMRSSQKTLSQVRPINHAKAHVPEVAKTIVLRQAGSSASEEVAVHHTRATVNHTKAHHLQSSQTLMRKAVKRPAPSFYKQVQPAGTLQHTVPSLIAPKSSAASVDEARLARAQNIERSSHIGRHQAPSAQSTLAATIAPLAVAPAPVRPEAEVPTAAPAPEPPSTKPADIFEHALANATNFIDIHAHRSQFKRKARAHVTSMVAGTLALVVVAGFAAYVNSPNLQLKVASLRTGVSSTMPNLAAAGFNYRGVKTADDKVLLGFSNISGAYQLSQQNTNMSSADMIQTLGATDASGTPTYATVQAGKTTVYRFGNTMATWVSGGKWFTLTGNKALTNAQLTRFVEHA